MSAVVYLYGFVPGETESPPAGVVGIGGRAVSVTPTGPFAAAVSEVDEMEFRPEALEARLDDLAWVASQGARHETVVTWFADHATIIPARLLTVFSSPDALQAEAAARAEAITDGLTRFETAREWDLKVSYDRAELAHDLSGLSEETERMDREIEEAAPGRRYLLQRKRDEVALREAGQAAGKLARDLLDRLAELADEVIELELPTGREGLPVVLSAALLVPASEQEALQRRAGSIVPGLESRGVRARLTGPWAPYRFLAADSDG